MDTIENFSSTFRIRKLENGTIVPQKVWIMFFSNSGWLPLEDWDGNQLFWMLDEKGNTHDSIKQMAADKFPKTSWELAPCQGKDSNCGWIDNI